MKKVIALLLASLLAVCLLSACAGSGNPDTTEKPVAEEETKTLITDMVFNSLIETDNFDFYLTNFFFSDKANDPDNSSTALLARKGYCYANVVFEAKYKGKENMSFPAAFGYCQLNYGDGYSFDSGREWFFDSSLEAWLSMGEIRPLMPEFGIAYNIEVPLEVRDNTDNPLSITLHHNGQSYNFSFRPMSDANIAEYSKIAESLMNNGNAEKANEYYQELNKYGDFSSESANTTLYKYIYTSMAGKSGEAWEYFQSHMEEYPDVSGEEIREIFNGNWYGFNTNRLWTINADGSIDDGFDYRKSGYGDFKRSWWVDGDVLALTSISTSGAPQTKYYTLKRIDADSYLLLEDGTVAASMTKNIP